MDANISRTNASKPVTGHYQFPTHDQMAITYRNITEGVEKAHKLHKLAKAPAGYSKAPQYNITRPGMLGVGRTVYVIKGEMYLKTQVVSPTAKPSWFKVGPAPLF